MATLAENASGTFLEWCYLKASDHLDHMVPLRVMDSNKYVFCILTYWYYLKASKSFDIIVLLRFIDSSGRVSVVSTCL